MAIKPTEVKPHGKFSARDVNNVFRAVVRSDTVASSFPGTFGPAGGSLIIPEGIEVTLAKVVAEPGGEFPEYNPNLRVMWAKTFVARWPEDAPPPETPIDPADDTTKLEEDANSSLGPFQVFSLVGWLPEDTVVWLLNLNGNHFVFHATPYASLLNFVLTSDLTEDGGTAEVRLTGHHHGFPPNATYNEEADPPGWFVTVVNRMGFSGSEDGIGNATPYVSEVGTIGYEINQLECPVPE